MEVFVDFWTPRVVYFIMCRSALTLRPGESFVCPILSRNRWARRSNTDKNFNSLGISKIPDRLKARTAARNRYLHAVHQTIHVIDFFIRPVSPVILPQVFDGGDRQNKNDRSESKFWLESVDNWDKIQQSDEDEVDVGEPVELLKEVLW